MSKIFISVASFVDPYLSFTIQNACESAKHPENLVFGVVDQAPDNRRQSLNDLKLNAEIRYIHIDPVESRGVCWARSLVQSLYNDEAYYLQIDSHTYFEKDWDIRLISQLQSLSKTNQKPMLSVYPYGFEFEEDRPVVKVRVGQQTTLVLRTKPNEELEEKNPVLHFRAEHQKIREPVLGFHVAGGFIFTHGQFVNEVPYDPRLYFHGEEQSLAVRAYTHGWDIFHPPEIPLYHLYKQPDNAYTTHHWHKDWDQKRDYAWHELRASAIERLIKLLYEQQDLGAFGLGSVRTLQQFAEFSGIDYLQKTMNFEHLPKTM